MVRFLPCTSTRLSDGVPYVVQENTTYFIYIVKVPGTQYQVFVNLAPGDPGRDIIHVGMVVFFRYLS